MNPLPLNMDRFTRPPTTDAPHELSEAVNKIKAAGLVTDDYTAGYWLRMVSACSYDHPAFEIERLLRRMISTRDWIKRNRGENINCGAWLTNRLKEQARGPQPRK